MQKLLFGSLFLLLSVQILLAQGGGYYFPPLVGNSWQTLSPASQGFCPDKVDSLYQFLEDRNTKSFLLLKDGKIVLERYFGTFTQDSFWYWASAGKSLTAFLVGQAQEAGLLDIDEPTSTYLGTGWTSCPPAKEALISVRSQLTMTNGLNDNLPPTPTVPDPDNCGTPPCLTYLADAGTRWAYHNAPYRLLHDVIQAASGQNINLFTKTKLFDRVGMRGIWIDHIMYGRARDMARFGSLVLADGIWNGDTLLHDAAYKLAMRTPSQGINQSYGYLWWLNGQPTFMLPDLQFVFPGKLCPNAPDDMFAALGKNDQKIHVVPSKGWVIVRQGNASGIVGVGGNQVPTAFDNQLWARLNALVCGSVATDVPETAAPPRIFPNPATDFWQIEAQQALLGVALYDAQGRLLLERQALPANQPWRLECADLPTGAYWLRALGAAGATWHQLSKVPRRD
jgi:CubicO group peptidase (beta-lactamase class C family)